MARVFAFLDLPQAPHIDFAPQNVGDYHGQDAPARAALEKFYRPHNERLAAMTGIALDW
jgi:hypothetical protein